MGQLAVEERTGRSMGEAPEGESIPIFDVTAVVLRDPA
jgi:hypothetical protein